MQNVPREHSAILLTFIKLLFVLKTFVLSFFERPLRTGFSVTVFVEAVTASNATSFLYFEIEHYFFQMFCIGQDEHNFKPKL